MKRSRWFEPYVKDKAGNYRAALSDSWDLKRAGVYFIRDAGTRELVYIGRSGSQLKKTIYRHFQEWKDNSQYRVQYEKEGFEIRFIYTTALQAERLERHFIKKLRPRDNEQKYEGFFAQLTAPSETKLKELSKEAEFAPFLKKGEYIDDEPAPF